MFTLIRIACLALVMSCAPALQAQSGLTLAAEDRGLQVRLNALQAKSDEERGFAMALIEGGRLQSAATGVADSNGTPMFAETPFRLASVTKTFVAAAALRLYEQRKLDLDAPITAHIAPQHTELLKADGYDPAAITIRHLLMHAGGLDDHFGSDEGKAAAFANPQRRWTRSEQLALMTEFTDPLGKPGERFHYSDTGYILIGEIIEGITGEPLPIAVRRLNGLGTLGIGAMRWEALDGPEEGEPRAHQWFQGFDIHGVDGSIDGFGGGGLIANVIDTARYYEALFGGKVFASSETLDLMLAAPSHPEGSPYRFGLFTMMIGDHAVYMHGGFWGVQAMHVPSLELTIVGVSLDETGYADMRTMAFDLVKNRAARRSR